MPLTAAQLRARYAQLKKEEEERELAEQAERRRQEDERKRRVAAEEAVIRRQIAEAEEAEKRAVEQKRVAEEQRRLAEEQKRLAEEQKSVAERKRHTAAATPRESSFRLKIFILSTFVDTEICAGDEDDPLYLPSEPEKGKGKVKEGYTAMGGDARCPACVDKDQVCEVDVQAVKRWKEGVAKGKMYTKAPARTACRRCQRNKYKCLLPATTGLRKRLREQEPDSPSSQPAKKPRVAEQVEEVGDFGSSLAPILQLLTKIGKQLHKGVEEDRRATIALERIAGLLETRWPVTKGAEEGAGAEENEEEKATDKEDVVMGGTGEAGDTIEQ